MRNKFPGTCYQCGLLVPAGAGYFERDQKLHIWKVQHRECCWKARDEAKRRAPDAVTVESAGAALPEFREPISRTGKVVEIKPLDLLGDDRPINTSAD